ncbi:MAG: 3-phosphoshikimate 1-carboxyvinyltransferase [Candidatus Omnitrophica bacterium]|nr:3-phosphoshikimate 1-carboxyvinyltransferase [Candidatus Omnitrophota bacterium]
MTIFNIKPLRCVHARIPIPADKSISHRALIISAIAEGATEIRNFLESQDTLATMGCLKKMKIKMSYSKLLRRVIVTGKGLKWPKSKPLSLYASSSGTTIRILSGILAGQESEVTFNASEGLRRRPMARITAPLRKMNARIEGRKIKSNEYPPLVIRPAQGLCGIHYILPQASAQVKTALLFASLYAQGPTRIKEPYPCRDHTERMLTLFKAAIRTERGYIVSTPVKKLKGPRTLFVPGDFSSAAFFIAAGVLLEQSKITLPRIGINPTRIGFLGLLKKMGARIELKNKKNYFEPYADIVVSSSRLRALTVNARQVPLLIDELPILMVCASFARGTTRIYGLKELKVKETDRITSMVYNLRKAGVDITAGQYGKKKDWKVVIRGNPAFKSACPLRFKSFSDHRTAMSMIVFGIASGCRHSIDDIRCIDKSFPGFVALVKSLYR